MTLSRLVLWRHGETDHNASGRLQGHLDTRLTETGRAQARRAAPALVRFEPAIVVTSDLRRAADTAAAFHAITGIDMRVDIRLRETHLGDWQGLSGIEVEEGWPGALTRWREDPRWRPPGGESRVEVADRAEIVVAELDAEHDGTAMLCAHGGLIVALTGRLLGLNPAEWRLLVGVGNCHWTVLERRLSDGMQWRLRQYNTGVVE
ncbi:2,3-bisphosphoglycerate-dependent phosphoglycerate mutase/probable phosphoglycerate mutase [Actinoalloteichus hoggarensis]|uniref:Glucosyl-3-phosphoglycerate phosphatase n=1 Tax=Actinoalloteichus hoggarensis TaxID=1470176 RepID=A0A221W0A6_9PSEU|nr:histidine phosphatase family protein [Actinoalloteichus hoggarensis]ASO19194.1 Glucosyl-3-phosphoglycerate phosphatase [Actinoalloteichus hoggarensis]MBB5920431.1 2,3-bisphosphoglycerate-dependent phosphoglycerate mutase/probable phosphoglycerate mutase [Actinoalloteichus hoggarensis]